MYFRTNVELRPQPSLLGQPDAKQYQPPFTKGGEAIGESDGPKLLTILTGPSAYQGYISPIVKKHSTAIPKNFLHIVTNVGTQVPKPLQGLFTKSDGKLVGGTIDRWTRTIYTVEAPGLRDATRVQYALHEAVHVLAHPVVPPRSCPRICVGTFQAKYGTGFGEGATQVITESIMDDQNISRYYRDQPYEAFTAPMREIIRIFSLDKFARAYFWGEIDEFTRLMEARWGNAWRNVANFTSAKDTKRALAEIKRLEAAHQQGLWNRGPKGDFPSPSRFSRIA